MPNAAPPASCHRVENIKYGIGPIKLIAFGWAVHCGQGGRIDAHSHKL